MSSQRTTSKAVNPITKLKKGVKKLMKDTSEHLQAVDSLESKRALLGRILLALDTELQKADALASRLKL